MPDEERIEQLELEVKVLRANNKGLKDKIDEQSKEIEELKEIYQTGYVNGCVSKVYEINKKWKDKIKAKIEEIDFMIKKINQGHLQKYTIGELLCVKRFLQSLLDKEV